MNEEETAISIVAFDVYLKMTEAYVKSGNIQTDFYQKFKDLKNDFDDLMDK